MGKRGSEVPPAPLGRMNLSLYAEGTYEVGEVELRCNKDQDAEFARRFPDGFLHFRYVLELYPAKDLNGAAEATYVGELLKLFWSNGFPAVASGDYEDQLPFGGGYRDSSLPWPCEIHQVP